MTQTKASIPRISTKILKPRLAYRRLSGPPFSVAMLEMSCQKRQQHAFPFDGHVSPHRGASLLSIPPAKPPFRLSANPVTGILQRLREHIPRFLASKPGQRLHSLLPRSRIIA